MIMKFESLPNEILLHCFEYLNAPDIFYAFEQLNPRFYRLIRTIPLRLNFENINKLVFDRFCEKMLDYTEIQQQIYSIKLSNEGTHGQIQAFLTYFALNEFSQLRSLTLIEFKENNLEQLSSTLPLLSQLTSLRLVRSLMTSTSLIDRLPKCKLNQLSSCQEIIPLTKLSVKFCTMNECYQLLHRMPYLQSLTILRGIQFASMSSDDIDLLRGRLNQLKYLSILDCMVDASNLMSVIAQMINLRSLTVSEGENSDIINASCWQHLIVSSLPNLTVFRFKFGVFDRNKILRKHEEFQSEFWIKEHQWYTECLLGDRIKSYIFTISYFGDGVSMWLHYVRHCNESVDNSNTFNNVKSLCLSGKELINTTGFYFPNITSLSIRALPNLVNEDDEQRFIDALKRTMNLSGIQHLEIPFCAQTTRPTLLLKVFKEAPHLTSLNTHTCVIDGLKYSKNICQYTSRMIRKVQFCVTSESNPCGRELTLASVHEVFPNIERMDCFTVKPDECLSIMHDLPKLSSLSIHIFEYTYANPFAKVQEELLKFRNTFLYKELLREHGPLKIYGFNIWVNRDQ